MAQFSFHLDSYSLKHFEYFHSFLQHTNPHTNQFHILSSLFHFSIHFLDLLFHSFHQSNIQHHFSHIYHSLCNILRYRLEFDSINPNYNKLTYYQHIRSFGYYQHQIHESFESICLCSNILQSSLYQSLYHIQFHNHLDSFLHQIHLDRSHNNHHPLHSLYLSFELSLSILLYYFQSFFDLHCHFLVTNPSSLSVALYHSYILLLHQLVYHFSLSMQDSRFHD